MNLIFFRKAINVKVIQTANLKPEYLVEPGHELVLPCVHGVEAAMLANLLWRFDDKVIKDAPEAEIRPRNGSLQISKYIMNINIFTLHHFIKLYL